MSDALPISSLISQGPPPHWGYRIAMAVVLSSMTAGGPGGVSVDPVSVPLHLQAIHSTVLLASSKLQASYRHYQLGESRQTCTPPKRIEF